MMDKNSPGINSPRRIPAWLRIVLVVVALLVLAGLAAPYFLDADQYRATLASLLEKQTGRKVTLGKIQARFLPSLGFTVDGVHLGNPPGFPPGDFLSVETLRGGLAWGPLLHRQIQVTSLELVKPKLVLLQDGRGRTNYDFAATGENGMRRGTGRAGSGSESGGSSFALQEIGKIVLNDGGVDLGEITRGRTRTSTRINGLDLVLRDVALDATLLPRLKGQADLSGMTVYSSAMGEPIEFKSGKLNVADGRAEGNFRAQLGKAAEVKGALKVADLSKPVLEFELATSQLDLDALFATAANAGKPGDDPPGDPSPRGPSALLARGKIAAERIRYAPFTANNGVAELRVFSDRIEAFPAHVEIYGGVLQIAARGDLSQTPMRFSANLKLNNIDVGKLASVDPASKGKITGTADMTLQVLGSAGPRLAQTLAGDGEFTIRDGLLPGLNLPGALASISRLAGGGESASTPFTLIHADLAVRQGRVGSKQVHMDSSLGTVDMRGNFGFDGGIEYDGQAVLVPGAGGGGAGQAAVGALTGILGRAMGTNVTKAAIPFAVRGTLSNPKIMPGKGLPKIETASPTQTQTAPPPKPTLEDTLKGLFRKKP